MMKRNGGFRCLIQANELFHPLNYICECRNDPISVQKLNIDIVVAAARNK